jgi:hypothetical protein
MISERAKRVGLKELAIFDYFEIDHNLPKYKKVVKLRYDGDMEMEDSNLPQITINNSGAWIGTPMSGGVSYTKLSFRERIANWLLKNTTKQEKEKRVVSKISIIEFFTRLSGSYTELTPIAEVAQHYEKALVQANTMGQTALFEKLKDLIDVIKGEAILIAMGLKKYVTEEQIVNFYEQVGEDKHLKLTWIRNFGRIIPERIYEAKKSVDGRKIFDNYVILHYDPENNGEKLTKKQVEDKKDPILFGVIKNSRKLYFIADWKDDYCELTLEEMFNVLGEKTLIINNKNVKTFIDNVTI